MKAKAKKSGKSGKRTTASRRTSKDLTASGKSVKGGLVKPGRRYTGETIEPELL